MDFGLDPASYSIAITIFTRLLGAIYVIAYIPFLFDIRGLLGRDGIRPVTEYLKHVREKLGWKAYLQVPSLFWLNAGDAALLGLMWLGIGLGVLVMLGIHPALCLLLLYIVHLSLRSVGQEFLGFGWESLLMETTVAAVLTLATAPYNIVGWIALNFVLLRFHVQAGLSKLLSRDKTWRDLTACTYHYLTQPLPNTIAWYAHRWPVWIHKLAVLTTFYVELLVPLAIFVPPEVRLAVFIQLVGFQIVIWTTGNLSYLNHLTVVMCVILVHNRYLEPFLSAPSTPEASPFLWQLIISILALAFLGLQVINLFNTLFRTRFFSRLLYTMQPYHIAIPHGLFAVITTKRYEIIIEGSNDGQVWREYLFYFKPGDLAWRPRRISPYQPRLDWQAWFLPFGPFRSQGWFQRFIIKLLQGSPTVVKLLRYNPFAEKPPVFIRVLLYDYEFTSPEEKAKTGNWWKRRLVGEYASSMRLMGPDERRSQNLTR